MIDTLASVVGGVAEICVEDTIKNKAAQFVDEKFRDPRLISLINQSIVEKYGDRIYYNDLSKYLKYAHTIENLISMFYNAEEVQCRENFVNNNTTAFANKFKTSPVEKKEIEEVFFYIYDEVYNKKILLDPHSDAGKLQIDIHRIENKIDSSLENIGNIERTISSYNERLSTQLGNLTMVATSDIGKPTLKIKEFLAKIEGVGGKENPVANEENAIEKYMEILAEIPTKLRGEDQSQIDNVVCCVKCHLALAYSNIGDVKQALKQFEEIQENIAKESKLYHFVKAAIIVNLSIEKEYIEAKKHIDIALKLGGKYHTAFFVKQYTVALLKEEELDTIIKSLDSYYISISESDKDDNLIATYFMYRALIYKEFDSYDEAIDNYNSAKKYGYDKNVVDYNIAALYYRKAIENIPKNTRVFDANIKIADIVQAITILKALLFGEKVNIPKILKSRIVSIYVSSCSLLGIKHNLKPINDYINLPDLDYEVVRLIILGSHENIADSEIALLKGEDKTSARISNLLNKNDYKSIKKIFFDMPQNELSVLNQGHVYMLLQACVIDEDYSSYWEYRYLADKYNNGDLLECLDAYAYEKTNIEKAKQIVDKHVLTSNDYHILSNIGNFYFRNSFDDELVRLYIRILELKEQSVIFIDDILQFYERAITFLIKIKSSNIERFINALDSEKLSDISVNKIKFNYYNAIGDIKHLCDCASEIYCATKDYKDGYNKIVCLIRLMQYEKALDLALSLFDDLPKDKIKEKKQIIMLISDIYLFLEDNDNSFLWAKKAHEMFLQNPYDDSHQFYMGRATRTNHMEAISDTIEYKHTHPVVLEEWFKEFKISDKDPVDDIKRAVEEISGESHDEYEKREAEVAEIYRSNHISNSLLLKHYNHSLSQLFIFASQHKLSIAEGNIKNIDSEVEIICDDIFVDALTLIIMKKYGCFETLDKIKYVHICFSTIEYLQSFMSGIDAFYVLDVLKWIKNSTNVILEPNGFQYEPQVTEFFSDEFISCCIASINKNIPLLTTEPIIRLLQKHKIEIVPLNVKTVSITAFCYAVLKDEMQKVSQMLYGLLADCRFISFRAETILLQIRNSNYKIEKNYLNRFFICDTSCDMISFANVYLNVMKILFEEQYDAAVEFTKLVLEDGKRIWNRSDYYRYNLENDSSDEESKYKLASIECYLIYLVKGISQLYKEIPVEFKNEYFNLKKVISHNITQNIMNA